MFKNMILNANIYINNQYNMEDYATCIKVFEKFCSVYGNCNISTDMFNFYFTTFIPSIYGKNEPQYNNTMLPAIIDFCHEYDMENKTNVVDFLYNLNCDIELDLKRVLKLKTEILKHTKSPYISYIPYMFDFSNNNIKRAYTDKKSGYFKMLEIFTNDSIVLNQISSYNSYVRVNVTPNIIKLLRKGDILNVSIAKVDNKKYYDIIDVFGCHVEYATDTKGISLREKI